MINNDKVEQIIDDFGEMLYRVALIHTKNNRDDADDIFQDIFLTLLKKNIAFKDSEHCKAWLLRVTVNLCKKYHNRKPYFLIETSEIEKIIDSSGSIQMDNDCQTIYENICILPYKYMTVIILYYFEELSCKEIADCLHMTLSSVRKRLSRGRQYLKVRLEEKNER